MARNKMSDVRDHLFMALERLGDEDLSGDKLQEEVTRCKQIKEIASVLIESAKTEVDFLRVTGSLKGSAFLNDCLPGQNQLGE
jgi:hypothetical protein